MVRAYSELSTCRPFTGMGIGPIPVTAIWAWADRHRLDQQLTAHLVDIIRRVDAETLRRATARASAATKKGR